MRHFFISKIIVTLCLAAVLFGFSFALPGQDARDVGDKQYVRVDTKSGEVLLFDYRSFLEMNFEIQVGNPARPNPDEDFGEKRVTFTEKDSCTQHRISMDNLQEIEFMGIAVNDCTNRKEWVFKVYLLDLDKYVGFFKKSEPNMSKALSQHGMMGRALDSAEAKELPFDSIRSIRFFPR